MGKSTSCFKIITCGSDSKDADDVDITESKGSGDKRGWSFRKRSARHRVLSNAVITETPSSTNGIKDRLETVSLEANSSVPEKPSVLHYTDEKPQLFAPEIPKVSEVVVIAQDESKDEAKLEESDVVVIQSAIRGVLAQAALLKLKNVVKLQAAVRGHLVRSHAVGTLRCVQAIVKMQALVRGRRSRLALEGSNIEKLDGNHEKEDKFGKSNMTYISIEKLLSNRFARQLLESTPKTKPINIKCDPLKSDSAWRWLERWMSVSSVNIVEPQKAELSAEKTKIEEKNFASSLNSGVVLENTSELDESRSNNEEKLIIHDEESSNIQAYNTASSPIRESFKPPCSEKASVYDISETLAAEKSLPEQTQSNADSPMQHNSHMEKHEVEIECHRPINGPFVSIKATNPTFIAAQSKFEVLNTTVNPRTSISLSSRDSGVDLCGDTSSSMAGAVVGTSEVNAAENVVPTGSSVIQIGGSECGTELSISSTLDSPDTYESGAFEQNNNVAEEDIHSPNRTENADTEIKDAPTIPISDLSQPVSDQPEKKPDFDNSESIYSEVALDSTQIEETERNKLHLQRVLDTEAGHQAYRSSPEASPRSHVTVPETQETPSSQVSVKTNQHKNEKSGSNLKRKSLSAGKKSPLNTNQDSGSRSSTDQKNGKRRNSFGSARPDHIEQDSRESSAKSSLPHFMQATESARAKVQSNSSPRSSPDMQDREFYIKKRHSLPGANGRQGSPRIQRSMSQAQQGAKANERKWQR